MRENIDFIEFHLNQNKYSVLQQMFQGEYRYIVRADNIVVDKSKYVIVLENNEWKVYPMRNSNMCTNINIANWWIAMHKDAQITRNMMEGDWGFIILYDEEGRRVEHFSLYQIDIRYGENNYYLVPLSMYIGEEETYHSFEILREGRDTLMITNNLNDFKITSSGNLIIDTDGIKFEEAYGHKWNKIVSMEDMINIYGNDAVRRIWNYVNSPSKNISETFIKEQIKKILLEDGEN